MKTVQITVENQKTITAEAGKRLSDALLEAGIYVSAPCGGVGKCGKCKIVLLAGELPMTDADRRFLDAGELEQGCRLACAARVERDLSIRLLIPDEEQFHVLAGGGTAQAVTGKASFGIAVDIGTTTLAAELIELGTKASVATAAAINHQRSYGADVVSRIAAATGGKAKMLQKSIRDDLNALIGRLLSEGGCAPEQMRRVALSANTAMGHLLLGYPCEGLGAYPFTPHNIGTVTEEAGAVLGGGTPLHCPLTVLPGISAYVGGDIAAGLLTCGVYEKERPVLLLDLGTNGEMAVGNRERILVASAAAGPAFEGGNISCGTGSIPGAICNVEIRDEGTRVKTIGDAPANGLCGTGVIETVRELLVHGLMDETGLLDGAYEDAGFVLAVTPEGKPIALTQRDVREIQLAKSAVRAGVETLLLRYGITCEDVEEVYVAGGFGFHLDIGKAVDIGLLPEALRHKVRAVGNTSLQGAARYLTRTAAPEQLAGLIGAAEEVALAMDPDFNELYMEHMMF